MEVVLADALLAGGGDRCALLRAVSAPLSAERAEALRLLLQRLAAGGPPPPGEAEAEAEALRRAAWEVALERCRPLLRGGDGAAAAGCGERARLARAARGALRHCVQLCGAPLAARLARDALAELAAGGGAGAEAAVEALVAAAPRLEEPELVARCVAAALALVREEGEGEAAAALVAGRLLPALGGNGAALRRVWEGLLGTGGGAPPPPGRALLALSAMADALLPRGPPGPDARLCPRFWRVVQEGLTERDGLCRKRARYLLQRAVDLSGGQGGELRCPAGGGDEPSLFWWSAEKSEELLRFWETYVLIMETLEGNQIHVIKPVLPKLNSLYEHAISGEKGSWLFHPSWHMCIYKRMFESENKTLMKEGVLHFLELYETKHLPNSLGFSEFIIGPLMDALSESSLYSRTPGQLMGACPPLGMRLQKFLATYLLLLPEEQKGSFLLKFIQKMTSRHWCAVPILFLSMALAYIPACKVLGTEGLHALRDVLQCTMITHQILLRGAAQCYLLETAMHLTDVEKVSLPEVASFLLSLRPEESLRRDTMLWVELCSWLQVNDGCFRKSITFDSERQETSSLCQYVRSLVGEYLKTPASERENCFMPDWFEAKLVATVILLAADVEQMRNKYSGKSNIEWIELEAFLNPLLDVLMKLGSNAYIPTLKTDKSLQLLLKLLQTRSLKCSNTQDDRVLVFIWKSLMTPVESILDFVLRRLTTNELSTVGDLDRCDLYLALIPETVNLCLQVSWKKVQSIKNFILSLTNASIRNLQERNCEEDEEKLKTSICTFLSVLSHFDIVLQNTSEKKPALKKALVVVLQWCFNHNFSVRLYALVALKKVWGMCRLLRVEEFEALTPVIESSLQQVENMHGTGNARRNWQRIQDHFFFATFHPLEDYSLETIFYTLPRLSELAEDEWISLVKFDRFTDIPLPPTFQWYCSRTELLDLKPSDWSQQDMGSNSVETDSQTEWTDVQKKIIPWKNSTPSLDLEMVFQDRAAKLGKSNSRLIVVASLIDKPTNLGGLCRTSEIFGASALVVGSLHYIQDKQFQHLSVSAEQWLPLVEVKPSQLVDYLQQKKTEGYTIIGVEQTAKSFDLTEYCFPEKSLLLLGNEHEGIPANLIHHLDVCVEIPQQGIIRSLNVHVSGALLIWEYTRQQVIKQKQQK
ncbi:putative methyltransferase TARBP1 isoform 5-T5 [Morus bassanus]